MMSKLLLALLFSSMLLSNVVVAEEAAIPADTADKNIELMQQAADGEVAMPRPSPNAEQSAADPSTTGLPTTDLSTSVESGRVAQPAKKLIKPNRMLMHASVNNSKAGYAFLDENQRLPGVIKLKSGLQYKILKAGTGAKVSENDVVKCQYRGALIDGTVFEQSTAGKPANIKIAPLVSGLKEAMLLMPIGSKWEVYIPSELGFGSAGKPPKVGPEAVLVYNLELVGIAQPASVKP
jgi:FKBP-type peptidyl-prolyl cis-trans isomerase